MGSTVHDDSIRLKTPPGYDVDIDLLRALERGLDPARPEQSRVPAKVLGYGEISTVFAIQQAGLEGLAFKRLPIFEAGEELDTYEAIYQEYIRVLEEEADVRTVPQGYAAFSSDTGRPIFYIIQQQLPADSVGHNTVNWLNADEVNQLFRLILREMHKVWHFNQTQKRLEVALDGQISNWAVAGFDTKQPSLGKDTKLLYMDTSTPLFRVAGVEQLNPELFLRSAPSFLRWVLRLLFLEDVVNRYYDFHLVIVDFIANFYKEQHPTLIPGLVETANDFFTKEATPLNLESITEKEVLDYYKEDAQIWRLYLGARRIDRFLHTRLLRKEYPYILPGKIKR